MDRRAQGRALRILWSAGIAWLCSVCAPWRPACIFLFAALFRTRPDGETNARHVAFCVSAPGLLAAKARAWFSAPRGGEVAVFSADRRFLCHHGHRATGGSDG